MFKLVKWAYDMGVRQERLRIKNAINDIRRKTTDDMALYNILIEDVQTIDERRQQLDKKLAVNNEVTHVLEYLFKPQGRWVENAGAIIDGDK